MYAHRHSWFRPGRGNLHAIQAHFCRSTVKSHIHKQKFTVAVLCVYRHLYEYAHSHSWFRPGHGDLHASLELYSKCQDGRFRREDHTGYKMPAYCTPLEVGLASSKAVGFAVLIDIHVLRHCRLMCCLPDHFWKCLWMGLSLLLCISSLRLG